VLCGAVAAGSRNRSFQSEMAARSHMPGSVPPRVLANAARTSTSALLLTGTAQTLARRQKLQVRELRTLPSPLRSAAEPLLMLRRFCCCAASDASPS
jgi:hypothetical protein